MLKPIIQTKFALTSRSKVDRQIAHELQANLDIVRALTTNLAETKADVGNMLGIDPEMQQWSPYQTLEHNAIVNRNIANIVESLAAEREHVTDFNIKEDVLPKERSGPEAVADFETSVNEYQAQVAKIDDLHSKSVFRHPIFGSFDAHKWHCMFAFHLTIHRRQLIKAARILRR